MQTLVINYGYISSRKSAFQDNTFSKRQEFEFSS
ncbi:uncharacterized protein METZ01_LOCUS323254 [marine metagenome]|uniref:Uncharacterized protein n=1 Tax=marine metagenome TaxID=408172 RepID=A0A382PC55_9ZZZZ